MLIEKDKRGIELQLLYSDENFSVPEGATQVLACACDDSLTDYYITFNHKNLGLTTVIFTPDDDMLELMKPALPRTLRK